MLVLTRKVGESLVIGDNVVVTVVALKGGQVRIGIEAPRDISIQRDELLSKDEENASLSLNPDLNSAIERIQS